MVNSTSESSSSQSTKLLGDSLDAGGNDLGVLGVADADTLGGVRPGLRQAREEIMTRHDEDVSLFEAFVELLAREIGRASCRERV